MNTQKTIIATFFCLLFVSVFAIAQPRPTKAPPKKTRILFLLDGSGSMQARMGNSYRIVQAKKILSGLVDSLKVEKNLELALRVYGHQYDRRLKRCDDSRLEVGFSPNNHDVIKQKLDRISPQGTTPLAYSLEKAANDFPNEPNVRNVIIIITDGLESCDGDPCAISLALQKKNIFLRPFVVGLGNDVDFKNAYSCLGKYIDARNISEFKSALNQVIKQTLGRTTVTVELLNNQGKPVVRDVGITFFNNLTGRNEYDFIYFRDQNNKTDTLEIDPVMSYDISVNTTPAIFKKNVEIIGGQHNTIYIKVPYGSINISINPYSKYGAEALLPILIEKNGKFVGSGYVNEAKNLLVGKYDIKVMTLPVTHYNNVVINEQKTTNFNIEDPGSLGIRTSYEGVFQLFEIFENGGQNLVYEYQGTSKKIVIQPGFYKLLYRAKNAKGSDYTIVKKFKMNTRDVVNFSF